MADSWRPLLALFALIVGALILACDSGGPSGQGTATEPAADEADGANEGREAFAGVPVPSGAEETDSGPFTGTILFALPASNVDPDAYATLEFKEYRLDDPPKLVLDFYSDVLEDWDKVYVFTGAATESAGAYGVWTQDEGRVALWVGTTLVEGQTQLLVIRGGQD